MKDKFHSKLTEHFTQLGPAILVLAASMWFFMYMSRQEVSQSYPKIQLGCVASQGKLVKNAMEGFLNAGVPLRQCAGFKVLADRLLVSDPIVEKIQVVGMDHEVLFSHRQKKAETDKLPDWTAEIQENNTPQDVAYSLSKDEAFFQVTLPLNNKFERVGSLIVTVSRGRLLAPMELLFNRLAFYCLGLTVAFTALLFWLRTKRRFHQKWVLLVSFLPFLVGASLLINWVTQDLQVKAMEERSSTLAKAYSQRLDEALDLGLALDDFTGLEEQLTAVMHVDSNILNMMCAKNKQIFLATDPDMVGTTVKSSRRIQTITSRNDASLTVMVTMRDNLIRVGFFNIIGSHVWPFLYAMLMSIILLFLMDHFLAVGFRTVKIPATFVLTLAFVLLYFVGLGEAYRGYPKLQLEKLAAQGESLRLGMEGFLKAGVPLRHFGGFQTLAKPLLATDESLNQIQVLDALGEMVFAEYGTPKQTQSQIQHELDFTQLKIDSPTEADFHFGESIGYYRVILPLKDKFEEVGSLVLTVHRGMIEAPIENAFDGLAMKMLALIALFLGLLFLGELFLGNRNPNFPHLCYGIVFVTAAGLVVATLTGLYTTGIEAKTRALSLSLGKRLEAVTTLGLSLSDFNGLDDTFHNYMTFNPELSSVALVKGDKVFIHTDPSRQNVAYHHEPDAFTHTTKLMGFSGKFELDHDYSVSLSIPRKAVRGHLFRSIKNFVVLFVATALLAALFLNLVSILGKQRDIMKRGESSSADLELMLVKILFFLVVFVEGLFASFLPLYLQDIASVGGSAGSASLLFTAYFLAFALSLIPSGNYAERHGVKLLMIWGSLITAVSAYSMTLVTGFYPIMILRILAGISQGMIFIGVQAFVLQVTNRDKTTQGTSVIVYGYNTGMISGTAIGALLVLYMGSFTVFRIGALISLFIFAFILFLIPDVGKKASETVEMSRMKGLLQWFKQVGVLFRDFQFIKAILLVGLTTKATMTGIVVYALPLTMARLGYPQDDIGQVLMFYATGVLLTNFFIPKIADRIGNTALILFWGTIGGGLGLLCVALVGMPWLAANTLAQTFCLIAGIFLLGISHGFIHAPIVTHIAFTRAVSTLGKATTTSIYRFLERIGHVLGPMIVGHLLIVHDYSAITFGYVGLALIVAGLLFILLQMPKGNRQSTVGDTQ